MKLDELVDIDRFRESLEPPSRGLFGTWQNTAFAIAHEKSFGIARTFEIWNEIPSEELGVDQIISYIEELLRILDTPDRQETLIRVEALSYRKDTEPNEPS